MIALHCKHLLSNCEAKRDIKTENSRIWLKRAKKDLTNYLNGNSVNVRYYFVLFLYIIYTFIILRSLMVTIIVDLSVIFLMEKQPLHC